MFGKLKRTAVSNNEGIGMGLMICEKLVTLNGGTISVKSDGRDMGSIFTFTMRMTIPSDEQNRVQRSKIAYSVSYEDS